MSKRHILILLLAIVMTLAFDLSVDENYDDNQSLMYLLKRKDKLSEPQFEIPAHFLKQLLKYRRY